MVHVRPSVRPSHDLPANGFAAVGPAARDIDRLLHGRRSAADASSVTLSADVGS